MQLQTTLTHPSHLALTYSTGGKKTRRAGRILAILGGLLLVFLALQCFGLGDYMFEFQESTMTGRTLRFREMTKFYEIESTLRPAMLIIGAPGVALIVLGTLSLVKRRPWTLPMTILSLIVGTLSVAGSVSEPINKLQYFPPMGPDGHGGIVSHRWIALTAAELAQILVGGILLSSVFLIWRERKMN